MLFPSGSYYSAAGQILSRLSLTLDLLFLGMLCYALRLLTLHQKLAIANPSTPSTPEPVQHVPELVENARAALHASVV